jgi:hypothetical protein
MDISPTAYTPPPIFADDSTPPPTPIMWGLEKVGVGKALENWGIAIGGYAEVGYMYDLTVPRDISPAKTAPGDALNFNGAYKNSVDPDQFDVAITRAIDATKGKWDVGFGVEGNYGRDATYFHSDGIYDNTVKDGTGGFAQPDLLQAYFDVAVPVGGGLLVKGGKFLTLIGNEVISPVGNAFYTHSYTFSYGEPLTNTGLTGTYYFNSTWNATAGITRGWNQSTIDNNGDPDGIAQVNYNGDKLTAYFNLETGPGDTSLVNHDNTNNVFLPNIVASYKLSDQLTVTGEGLWGYYNALTQWYGLVGYASYAFSSQLTFNVRAEWYGDENGFTTGSAAIHPGCTNFYEVTVGAKITPLPNDNLLKNLSFRPELRLDAADHSVLDPNGAGAGHPNEVTASIDATMVL